ncbi:MAG: ABC transporter permease [Anaerolineaceae bacterium]|nr:ABC transporter permease [Anaerolineaceae bacterium]
MAKIRSIIFHEITSILGRRSYRFTVLLIPLVGFMIYSGAFLVNRGIAPEGVTSFFEDNSSTAKQGVVDQSGIITHIPDDAAELVISFPNEESARAKIADGTISSYFVIGEDYLKSGKITFVQQDYNFLATTSETEVIRRIIIHNLFQDDALAKRYLDPAKFNITYTKEQVEKDFGRPDNFWLPYSLMILFYILIIGASSLMLTSITHEKQNKVMEILITSVSPTQMLVGKIIALGITGLLQTLIWLASGYVLIQLSGREFALPETFLLTPDLLAWGILFFMLGYAVYASMMAGLGALVPDPKEGSQATIVVIFPLIIPMFFSNVVASAPNAPLFIFFSIFPLTAPISMVSRMSATIVPGWQIALAVALQVATIIFIIRSVSRLFRAQTLLSGKHFHLKTYLRAFLNSK